MKTVKLDWNVKAEQIRTESGIIIPDHKAIVRDDNEAVLSVMGKGYVPYQNHELLNLLEKVGNKTGMEIVKEGFFGEGEKVYVQMKSDDLSLNGDKIEGYLTGINSFDGSVPLAFGPSTITISCMNSFFASFRQMKSRVRHTKNMSLKIEDILASMEIARKEELAVFEEIKKLADVRATKNNEEAVIRALFNIDPKLDLSNPEQISTVTFNRIGEFKTDLLGEMSQKGDNLWGLFSGVTKYTTHTMNKGDREKNTQAKMVSFYGERERAIFKDLVELA